MSPGCGPQDAPTKLAIYAQAVTQIQERLAPLFLALRDAAGVDAQLADLWRDVTERRAANMRLLAADLASTGQARVDLTLDQVADVIWSMNSAEYYTALVEGPCVDAGQVRAVAPGRVAAPSPQLSPLAGLGRLGRRFPLLMGIAAPAPPPRARCARRRARRRLTAAPDQAGEGEARLSEYQIVPYTFKVTVRAKPYERLMDGSERPE